MHQTLISSIDPSVDAAGVEAHMRLQYGALDHLPRETFAKEVALAKQCEVAQSGYLASVARLFVL